MGAGTRYLTAEQADRRLSLPPGLTEWWIAHARLQVAFWVFKGEIQRGVRAEAVRRLADQRRAQAVGTALWANARNGHDP